MTHRCHANGCEDEAHPELPLCKRHFNTLPEAHRKRLWAERPKGKCGACEPGQDDAGRMRSKDWDMLLNLGIAIVACVEAPEYEPQPEWQDDQGFCWMAGLYEAEKTVRIARKVIEKFKLSPPTNPVPY